MTTRDSLNAANLPSPAAGGAPVGGQEGAFKQSLVLVLLLGHDLHRMNKSHKKQPMKSQHGHQKGGPAVLP